MKKRFLLTAGLVIVLLVMAGGASAVTWGVPDNGEHPYVGTLLFQQTDGWYSCTGTLLDAKTVLTAGHCLEGGGVTNLRTYFMNSEDVMSTREDGEAFEDWLARDWVEAKKVFPHPQYDDFAQFPETFDVGIVKLAKPVKVGAYGTLPPVGFLETINGQDSRAAFMVVGYGMQGYINPFYSDIWARYKGTVSLIELHSNLNGGQSAKFTNNPGQGSGSGGSCFGDSGGPVFYGSGPMVVAVVSWGNSPCVGVDYQFRVDTQLAQDFIYAKW